MKKKIENKDQISSFITYITEFGRNANHAKIKGAVVVLTQAAKHFQKELVPYLDQILSNIRTLISQKAANDLH